MGEEINGKSAYELAVENGFKGSLKDYLYSLRGQDGKSAYELACENGFRGSVKQWLRSLHGNGGNINVKGNFDHEQQINLLGGNTSGHYHLTKEQYEWLTSQMSEKYPPVILAGQVINVIQNKAITPYEIKGQNVRK